MPPECIAERLLEHFKFGAASRGAVDAVTEWFTAFARGGEGCQLDYRRFAQFEQGETGIVVAVHMGYADFIETLGQIVPVGMVSKRNDCGIEVILVAAGVAQREQSVAHLPVLDECLAVGRP